MSSTAALSSGPPDDQQPLPRKSRRTRWGQSAAETAAEDDEVKSTEQTAEPALSVSVVGLATSSAAASDQPAAEPNAEVKPAVVAAVAAAAAGAAAVNTTARLLPPGLRPLPKNLRVPGATTASSQVLSDVATRAAAARAALEKAKKALALQKQIQQQVTAMRAGKTPGLVMPRGANPLITAGVAAALRALPHSKPMRFDRFGREVDAEGKVIELKPLAHSTLKVNINKEREAKLKQVAFQARVDRNLTNAATNRWFDPELGISGPKIRSKGLSFVEKGFYSKRERQMRAREQAQSMGLRLASESVENQKRRKEQEQQQLRRLLQYQRDQDKQNGNSDEDNEFEKMSDVPSRKYQDTSAFLKSLEYSDDESFSDDVDSGVTRRQEALHILQRRQLGIIPDIEWWDQPLLRRQPEMDRLDDEDPDFPYVIAEAAITDLVEHPVPIPPVIDKDAHVPTTLHLTPKERAKLRRRKRQEREKDKQDKIRMGLIPPPPPKVKLANLALVLGQKAVADPSRVEAEVREQVSTRLREHQERNEARRLDAEARRKKAVAKWTQPTGEAQCLPSGAEVCVFSVKDLSNRGYLFKVDKNAQQFHITGAAILCPQHGNLIIAEGTRKALRGYKKLLLRRIKWPIESAEAEADAHSAAKIDSASFSTSTEPRIAELPEADDELNSVLKGRGSSFCKLLWEGVVKERTFKQWKVYVCKSEAEVRKLLVDRHSEHYWDMLKKYRDPCQELI